jgi:hypothetical protein
MGKFYQILNITKLNLIPTYIHVSKNKGYLLIISNY